jgi:uncharacterized membrane protein
MITLTAPTGVLTEKSRISSIDLMRGLVMVIMALDHVRDFFHQGGLVSDPTNMATTTSAVFFTRWITHYCAPTFVFLAGTSVYLNSKRKAKKELSVFLLTRGLWLILLEVVVVRFGLFFNFYYDVIVFQVIWAIGASMVCMAALIHLSYRWILIIGLIVVFGHNIADNFSLQPGNSFFGVWGFMRQSGFFNLTPNTIMWVPYPLLPWLGIMMLGYCLGKLYTDFQPGKRQKLLLVLGLGTVGLFSVLRLVNGYGDPAPWSVQPTGVFTLMSFLNTSKYPASLLYTLMTLGPVLVLLSVMEKINLNILKPLVVFGRVPLFYYILHFFLIHALSLLFFMHKTGRSFSEIDFHFNQSFGGITPEGGYALRWAYVVWLCIVIALYPLCKWYNEYKSTHKHWWLSYL